MARAYGEVVVTDQYGNGKANVSVDLLDVVTGVRIPDTVYLDSTSSSTLTLPLTTDAYGRASFYLATGRLVKAVATSSGITYSDTIAVGDPTASGGVPAFHTHVESEVSNLQTDLNAKAPLAHAHVEGDVTNLSTDLGATEKTVNKNANSGYAGLDSGGHIGVTRINPSATNGQVLTTVTGATAWATPAAGGGANAPWQFAPDFQAPQSGDYAQMRCSVATSVTAFHAQRTGGTGANLDVLKNGVSILTAPLSLTATTDTTGTLTTNPTTFAIGDILKVVVSAQTGSPSDISTSVEGSRVTF